MSKKISALYILLFFVALARAQNVPLTKGLVIKRSVTIKKGIYKLDGFNSTGRSVIIIEGNNITVDFNGAVLKGSTAAKTPDEFFGVAVIIKKGKNIRLKNLVAKGYKIALLANGVENLSIENTDFSYNYRPLLKSTQEKEDLSDWMSYHQNEKDEWLRYGAAMYLRNCNSATIKNCNVTGGQNAVMMMECQGAMIYNNDFSFNSGIGLGMYKCSNNKVLYNKIIFNVRGYSHGVYNRGQDSAGILVYEQSNNNLFYRNNVTHSGDGFFLWAGQTTMDSGKGGCNDNILFRNDFSYAPTNGIELTFSRNKIFNNRIFECDHGIWGGYSFDTEISENQFRNNRIAIAIEHGQNNTIVNNLFYTDKEAIRLWARPEQPPEWGYAKYRDTRSRGYTIAINSFNRNETVFNLSRTDSIGVFSNRYNDYEVLFKTDSTVTNIDRQYNDSFVVNYSESEEIVVPAIANANDPFTGSGQLAGRKNIRMTRWGPYDFRYPLIWNPNPTDTTGILQFELLGPKGRWRVISTKGLKELSAKSGSFPAQVTAIKLSSSITDIEIVAEFVGASFTDRFGNKMAANKAHRLVLKKKSAIDLR